jgi:hypothetical protein
MEKKTKFRCDACGRILDYLSATEGTEDCEKTVSGNHVVGDVWVEVV